MKIKETDLAFRVVNWLDSQHWDVYQEVQINSSIADIVAVQGRLVWIVECKTSLSLSLIAQAIEWIHHAHFVSVAVPIRRQPYQTKAQFVAKNILKHYGIGLLRVPYNSQNLNEHSVKPKINRFARSECVKKMLNEKQKHWAPAGSQGGYWTPFKQTCREVVRIVNKNPGIILKDLIDKLDHHYASDKSAKACILSRCCLFS